MKLVDTIIYFKLCVERGQAWVNYLKTPVILSAGLKIFGLGLIASIVFVPVLVIATALLGAVDLKYGIWKRENEIHTRNLNPYFEHLEDKVEENRIQADARTKEIPQKQKKV